MISYAIYCLRNPTTNNIFYVGASGDCRKRKYTHIIANSSNLLEIRKLKKQNKIPLFEVLEKVSFCDMARKEKSWIVRLKKEGHVLENKNMIGNSRETKYGRQYNLRTTKFIINQFSVESTMKGVSLNVLFNKALLPIAKKYKAKFTNHKK